MWCFLQGLKDDFFSRQNIVVNKSFVVGHVNPSEQQWISLLIAIVGLWTIPITCIKLSGIPAGMKKKNCCAICFLDCPLQ